MIINRLLKNVRLASLLALPLFFATSESYAQLTLTGTGYTVTITVTPKSVNAPALASACQYGYGYTVNYDYSIVFTGTPPSGGLYTAQGYFTCDDNNNKYQYFDLPQTAGSGSLTSSNDYTTFTNCATVTPSSLNCLGSSKLILEISGLGITGGTTVAGTGSGSSDFFVTTPGGNVALPIKLNSFDGRRQGSDVLLTWITASETANQIFTIERSADAKSWKTIRTTAGAGTTNMEQTYRYLDASPDQGANYYRLKQTDNDGKSSYSNVISVQAATDAADVKVYPNPARTSSIHISGLSAPANWQMTVTNLASQILVSTALSGEDVTLPALSAGLYFIRLANEATKEVKVIKFVKE